MKFDDKVDLRRAKTILMSHEATQDLAYLVEGRIKDLERGVR